MAYKPDEIHCVQGSMEEALTKLGFWKGGGLTNGCVIYTIGNGNSETILMCQDKKEKVWVFPGGKVETLDEEIFGKVKITEKLELEGDPKIGTISREFAEETGQLAPPNSCIDKTYRFIFIGSKTGGKRVATAIYYIKLNQEKMNKIGYAFKLGNPIKIGKYQEMSDVQLKDMIFVKYVLQKFDSSKIRKRILYSTIAVFGKMEELHLEF